MSVWHGLLASRGGVQQNHGQQVDRATIRLPSLTLRVTIEGVTSSPNHRAYPTLPTVTRGQRVVYPSSRKVPGPEPIATPSPAVVVHSTSAVPAICAIAVHLIVACPPGMFVVFRISILIDSSAVLSSCSLPIDSSEVLARALSAR